MAIADGARARHQPPHRAALGRRRARTARHRHERSDRDVSGSRRAHRRARRTSPQPKGTLMTSPSWDDEAFTRRCLDLIEKKGLSLIELCDVCGIAPDYFTRPTDMRSTEIIVRLAYHLDVDPRWLALGPHPKHTPARDT